MKNINWEIFLQEVSEYINTETPKDSIYYDKSKIKDNWLGYEAVTFEAIKRKEDELKISLPSSYKEFLKTSNGFKQFSLFSGQLFKLSEIDWLINKDKYFVDLMESNMNEFPKISDEEYFIYGDDQDDEKMRLEYFRNLIQISEWVDGSIVFINPLIRFEDELECWIYSSWSLGASRYKSFADMMFECFELSRSILENEKKYS